MGRRRWLSMGGAALLAAGALAIPARAAVNTVSFPLVRSAGAQANNCAVQASGQVTITSIGPVEILDISVSGLPPNAEYDLFVLQLPDAPFGLSWYQGDVETDSQGRGSQRFIGRFNTETFFVAPQPGNAPAPIIHNNQQFNDQGSNPPFAPIHTFHLGLWFGSPSVASVAGCPTTLTPFNGDHTAGIQVLSTRNFPNDQGPLRQVTP